ncbi:MAG: heparinase II/III domain-containing protein [Candidatus Zipacnadales bacterium]
MRMGFVLQIVWGIGLAGCGQRANAAHPVPREHPRLFGSRAELQELARQRPEAYRRMANVAYEQQADEHSKLMSLALVSAIEGNAQLGRQAVEMALKLVHGGIRQGHETFGHDLAHCAIAYDLCFDQWTDEERAAAIEYINATVEANVDSETHVFHNGWYGYKNWGIGLACYATYYENPRAREILALLYEDYRTRAAPALELAGDGGGWAEGYYIHYFIYEWLVFCEVARRCEGIDLYAMAPSFYRNRAIAGMFEMYPGIREYGSHRPIPMGDSGGLVFGGDRDKELSARRILVNYYRDDPAHQAVHTFNETTSRSSVGVYAYKDFLWRDTTVPMGDLSKFRLSHLSRGPGYLYARSGWGEDATYFFFKCGDRFTAHQHLDVGHFLIYRHEELVGDGGWYEAFAGSHISNYYTRSIAHNTILVHDPNERWPDIRAAKTTGNDGGQHHNWPHHNGAVIDVQAWEKDRQLYDIGDILAFEDRGPYLYVAADCTRAYRSEKLALWTRQIVYLRPGTFVIFDRVTATRPTFRKTWVLQAMKSPVKQDGQYVITNGEGRLFIQLLLPEQRSVALYSGEKLYAYDGAAYPPSRSAPGPIPECRFEVSPSVPAERDYFLTLLTATDATENSVIEATAGEGPENELILRLGQIRIEFGTDTVSGGICIGEGVREDLVTEIITN